jgi:hypothetical protein
VPGDERFEYQGIHYATAAMEANFCDRKTGDKETREISNVFVMIHGAIIGERKIYRATPAGGISDNSIGSISRRQPTGIMVTARSS